MKTFWKLYYKICSTYQIEPPEGKKNHLTCKYIYKKKPQAIYYDCYTDFI